MSLQVLETFLNFSEEPSLNGVGRRASTVSEPNCKCEKEINLLINKITSDRPNGNIYIKFKFPSLYIKKDFHYEFKVKQVGFNFYYKLEVNPHSTSNINLYDIIDVYSKHRNHLI